MTRIDGGARALLAAGAICALGVASTSAMAQGVVPAVEEPTPSAGQQPTPGTPERGSRPPANVIAEGVRVAGVDVGGLNRVGARREIIRGYVQPRMRPLVVVHRGVRVGINPAAVGYAADIDYAIRAALLFGRNRQVPRNGVNIPLRQSVDVQRIERLLRARVSRFDVRPVDAAFSLRGATPVVRNARPGLSLDVTRASAVVRVQLLNRRRNVVPLPSRRVRPDVVSLPPAIIVDRGNFRLTLWRHNGRNETFRVAVGKASHPTPRGNFRVISKQVNPTWFPPNSPWAASLGPVPPGPGNPLGTRWIGTSAPAIGMHGTPVPSSIGTRASHGCIRMYMRDVERLYSQVSIGTPVYIR